SESERKEMGEGGSEGAALLCSSRRKECKDECRLSPAAQTTWGNLLAHRTRAGPWMGVRSHTHTHSPPHTHTRTHTHTHSPIGMFTFHPHTRTHKHGHTRPHTRAVNRLKKIN